MPSDVYYKVLDEGFIALKEVMGDDFTIEQAARTSYGKGTRKVSETRGLLRYLMRHKHTTPFEMVEFKFHIKVPMDCWRQWIRHRTANVNEYSTRYSVAIDDCQKTDPHRWRLQSKNNKQGSSGFVDCHGDYPVNFDEDAYPHPGYYLSEQEQELHEHARHVYEQRLDFGIAREQARKDLPLSNYTIAYWKCDLHNIFHFLRLRCDSHAQKEIRDYAMVMASLVKEHCPLAFEAWYDYAFGSANFTRLDRKLNAVLFDLVSKNGGHYLDYKEDSNLLVVEANKIGMSKREINEFWNKISIPDEQEFTLDGLETVKMDEEL